LDTFESIVQLLGGRRAALDLFERLVEDLCDIEQTNDIALIVADGLVGGENKREYGENREARESGTRWRKCRWTMSSRASVALVESRVTMGFLVMIALTGVLRGSRPSAATYEKSKWSVMRLKAMWLDWTRVVPDRQGLWQ